MSMFDLLLAMSLSERCRNGGVFYFKVTPLAVAT